MRRATSMLKSVAVAVVATAVGCLLVLTLLPSHARPWPTEVRTSGAPGAAPDRADVLGHGGSVARAATTGLDAATAAQPRHAQPRHAQPAHGKAAHGKPAHGRAKHAPRRPRIAVTAPQPGLSFRVNGSFSVAWTNNTGGEVDVWLHVRTRGKRTQRVALVAPRAGAGATGEALVTLPLVAPGRAYSLEVAAHDGVARAFSKGFAVTG
ncbi:hypothetical protein [Streptomyces sp. NPDC053427]|uniref:hypothetical protein n=1 Tax=Streptomyces sp. NPDC053427 TaxID=3365701 RepID=UPI0037D62BA9